MERRTAVATAVAGAAVLASVMVAGVAVVNATDSDEVERSSSLVVDDDQVVPAAAVPSMDPVPLPALPTLPSEPAAGLPDDPSDGASRAASPGTGSAVTKAGARALVLAAAPGEAVRTWRATRGGYEAFAVQVLRPDGSVVNGFVDRASGVVFDWAQVSGPTAGTYAGDDDDDDSGDEHGDDDDGDEHAEYDDDDD